MQKEFPRIFALTTDQDKDVVERLETKTINMKELAQFERDKLETLISNVSYLGEEDNTGVYIDALQEIEERIDALNVPKLDRSIQPKLREAMKRISDSLQQRCSCSYTIQQKQTTTVRRRRIALPTPSMGDNQQQLTHTPIFATALLI